MDEEVVPSSGKRRATIAANYYSIVEKLAIDLGI